MKKIQSTILCILTLYSQQLLPTLYIPLQTYSSLKNEAQTLVETREKFIKIYKKPYEPHATRDEKLYRLAQLNQLAQKWKKDKELFDRAMKISQKVGTIDSAQAFKVRMIIQMPRHNHFDINAILAEISQKITELKNK